MEITPTPKIDSKNDHSCHISRIRDSYHKGQRFISQGSEIHISRVRTFSVTESGVRVGDSNLKSQRLKFYYAFCMQSQESEIHISRV